MPPAHSVSPVYAEANGVLTNSGHRNHSHWVPDGIRAEQRDRVAFLKAMIFDKRRRDQSCVLLHLVESHSLLGRRIGESREFRGGSTEGGVFRVENKVPVGNRFGDYQIVSTRDM